MRPSSRVFYGDKLTLGRYVYVGPGCTLSGIGIGDGTVLAPDVVILSSTHDYRSGELYLLTYIPLKLAKLIGLATAQGFAQGARLTTAPWT
ncbi:MAG: hypothetical protein AB1648_02260 [Pseudomonadota bacterium]